jgi:hypothetical protein
MLPSFSKSPEDNGFPATIGSSETRGKRFARALGLSNIDRSQSDSGARTILEGKEKEADQVDSPMQPARAQFFGKVEKVRTKETDQLSDLEKGEAEAKVKPPSEASGSKGMKRNVWEVRKK